MPRFAPLRAVAWLCLGLSLHGCGDGGGPPYRPEYGERPAGEKVKEYAFGVHPLHNPARLFEVYGPLVDLLGARIPEVRFVLEASRNYEEFDKKLYARHFDLALPNPYQTLNSLASGYRVFGKMGDDERFRGIILVRKDSGIRSVADLRGKAVSFPAETALAATMLPQQFLRDRGLPFGAYEARYVGSQESSIMNVYLGDTVAGATWPPPWAAFQKDRPEYAAQLTVIWRTPNLPNNGLVARDDFPPELLKRVAATLFTLHETPQGQAILARLPLSRFEPATDATYRPVRDFVAHFGKTVRPLAPPKP